MQKQQNSDVAPRGRLDNAAEYVCTKLDDLVNWGRKVCKFIEHIYLAGNCGFTFCLTLLCVWLLLLFSIKDFVVSS